MNNRLPIRGMTPRLLMTLFVMILAALTSAQGVLLPPPPAPQTLLNQWVVKLAAGADPNQVAAQLGLINGGKLPGFADLYVFNGSGGIRALEAETSASVSSTLASRPEVLIVQQQVLLERLPRPVEDDIDDEYFDGQWHLNNTGQGGGTAGADANIFAAWNAGYTGTGVVVSSVDDGVWHANPDLSPNYLPSASWDFVGNDDDPSGGGHGTNVAGVMAAADDEPDDACGVGAAFTAQLSGIRLLEASSDANEASALTFEGDVIDIYNNSWGPSDNGATLEGPGPLTEAALAEGITNGRGGLGSIYVWAGGNGGNSDNANADGYVNSRYTIGVAASTNTGVRSGYSEQGAALLVNAPSNGGSLAITTTFETNDCTDDFGGTSSASPLAAGVVALILQANPNLTWRDVQHILVNTAEKNDPSHIGWFDNGAGHHFNHYYGFGRVDAGAAVALAETWNNVCAPETTADSGTINVGQAIPDGPAGAFVESTFNVTTLIQLESVDVVFNAAHASRGQLYIELVSPSGTTSVLMHGRPDTADDYNNWRLNTVANWDESSVGIWTLRVKDLSAGTTGTLNSWQLLVHGTEESSICAEMLRDTTFNPPALAWIISSDEGKIVCDKKFTSPSCSLRLKNLRPGENVSVKQLVDLDTYPLDFEAGDVLHLSGNAWAKSDANALVKFKVSYADAQADPSKVKVVISGIGEWSEIEGDSELARTDIDKVMVKIIDKSTVAGVKVWLDDFSVIHEHSTVPRTRTSGSDMLPLPAAPDGFRGNN